MLPPCPNVPKGRPVQRPPRASSHQPAGIATRTAQISCQALHLLLHLTSAPLGNILRVKRSQAFIQRPTWLSWQSLPRSFSTFISASSSLDRWPCREAAMRSCASSCREGGGERDGGTCWTRERGRERWCHVLDSCGRVRRNGDTCWEEGGCGEMGTRVGKREGAERWGHVLGRGRVRRDGDTCWEEGGGERNGDACWTRGRGREK